jgi:Molecular chaperone, HSP90 family
MTDMNFQVNLQGIIDLLSNHLYSDPGVFVRELLQNGVDAITARQRLGHAFDARITAELFPSSHTIAFQDNGCGLTEKDIEQFLARIGSTAKKEELDAGDDYIGQFGVGLLSCFVVSDEIVLITRSALEGDSLEWRGRPAGTLYDPQIAARRRDRHDRLFESEAGFRGIFRVLPAAGADDGVRTVFGDANIFEGRRLRAAD